MKKIINLWLLFLVSVAYGQQVTTVLESDSADAFLQLEGNVEIASSGITNSFMNRVYVDGFFTDEVKKEVQDRLNPKSNRYQSFNKIGLLYGTKGKKMNWSVSLKDVNSASMTFSQNLFSLLMYGNKRYTGQTLDLDNTLYVSQRYQSFGFGLDKEVGKWTLGVGVNILKGAYFNMFSLQNGSIYTAEDGTEVRAKGQLNTITSKSNRGTSFGGFGLSFNGFIRRELSDRIYVEVVANDIGFIKWRTLNQVEGNLDKTLTPTEIDDALNLNTTEFTLVKLSGLEQKETSFTYRTVGSVSARVKAQVTDRLFARAGMTFQTQQGALPLAYINPMYVLKQKHAVGVTLQAGGFSHKDIVLNYELKLKEKFHVGMNVNALETLISPKKTSSQGINGYFISYF